MYTQSVHQPLINEPGEVLPSQQQPTLYEGEKKKKKKSYSGEYEMCQTYLSPEYRNLSQHSQKC